MKDNGQILDYEMRRSRRWSWRRAALFALGIVIVGVIAAAIWPATVHRDAFTYPPAIQASPAAIAGFTLRTAAPLNANDQSDVTPRAYVFVQARRYPTTQPYVSPSVNAEKWDFGGGANTALNWSNWNGTAATPGKLNYLYQNPYPAT